MDFTQHHIYEFLANLLPESGQGEKIPHSFNMMLRTFGTPSQFLLIP
jgi:hypothetical protein